MNNYCKRFNTAKKLNINRLTEQIKKKTKKAKTVLKTLSKVKVPTPRQQNQLKGLKSKILKIQSLKKQLAQLQSTSRLHICFGSKKLFNAQYHLEENGYRNHQEWLKDWHKKRGGRFYCIGKAQNGGGTMIKIFHIFRQIKITMKRSSTSSHISTMTFGCCSQSTIQFQKP